MNGARLYRAPSPAGSNTAQRMALRAYPPLTQGEPVGLLQVGDEPAGGMGLMRGLGTLAWHAGRQFLPLAGLWPPSRGPSVAERKLEVRAQREALERIVTSDRLSRVQHADAIRALEDDLRFLADEGFPLLLRQYEQSRARGKSRVHALGDVRETEAQSGIGSYLAIRWAALRDMRDDEPEKIDDEVLPTFDEFDRLVRSGGKGFVATPDAPPPLRDPDVGMTLGQIAAAQQTAAQLGQAARWLFSPSQTPDPGPPEPLEAPPPSPPPPQAPLGGGEWAPAPRVRTSMDAAAPIWLRVVDFFFGGPSSGSRTPEQEAYIASGAWRQAPQLTSDAPVGPAERVDPRGLSDRYPANVFVGASVRQNEFNYKWSWLEELQKRMAGSASLGEAVKSLDDWGAPGYGEHAISSGRAPRGWKRGEKKPRFVLLLGDTADERRAKSSPESLGKMAASLAKHYGPEITIRTLIGAKEEEINAAFDELQEFAARHKAAGEAMILIATHGSHGGLDPAIPRHRSSLQGASVGFVNPGEGHWWVSEENMKAFFKGRWPREGAAYGPEPLQAPDPKASRTSEMQKLGSIILLIDACLAGAWIE